MSDFFMIALVVGGFAAAQAYAFMCNRLLFVAADQRDEDASS